MQTSAGTPVANVVGFFLPIGHSMHLNSHTKGIQRIEEVPFFFLFLCGWLGWFSICFGGLFWHECDFYIYIG